MGTVVAIIAGYYILSGQAFRDFANWKARKDNETKENKNNA